MLGEASAEINRASCGTLAKAADQILV